MPGTDRKEPVPPREQERREDRKERVMQEQGLSQDDRQTAGQDERGAGRPGGASSQGRIPRKQDGRP